MTVTEHERIDAGKDNAPRIAHLRRRGDAKALCGRTWTAARDYERGDKIPPHQRCVVCWDLAGGVW